MSSKRTVNELKSQCAEIEWRGETPFSKRFQDIYFSTRDPQGESQHVFLQHNQLAARWMQLHQNKQRNFVIAETGFGAGVNFLCAWNLWRMTQKIRHTLHFIAIENFPLSRDDLERSLRPLRALTPLDKQLLANYPAATFKGTHHLVFDGGSVRLSLHIGDVEEVLTQLSAFSSANSCEKVDAWFLDGFAPDKNPQMWSASVMKKAAAISKPGTTFSTFSAASSVRQALTEAGFQVDKASGFGEKKDMLYGTLQAARNPLPRQKKQQRPQQQTNQVTVIGGGMAGSFTAAALAARNMRVTVVERGKEPASGASGIAQAALYTRLSNDYWGSALACASLLHALRFYRQLQAKLPELLVQGRDYDFCGIMQLIHTPKLNKQLEQLRDLFAPFPKLLEIISAKRASLLSATNIKCQAMHWPQSGWINPKAFCKAALDHPNITFKAGHAVIQLVRRNNLWHVINSNKQIVSRTPLIVLANAHECASLLPTMGIPLNVVRGQISYIQSQTFCNMLRKVICYEGVALPREENARCSIGSSYLRDDRELALREAEHQENLKKLTTRFEDAEKDQLNICGGYVGLRCSTPDHTPIVGATPSPGLWVNIGYGSRGACQTPLCAELLAALISKELPPIAPELIPRLAPDRFESQARLA